MTYARQLHCLVWVTYPRRINILRKFYGLEPLPVVEPQADFPCEDTTGEVVK